MTFVLINFNCIIAKIISLVNYKIYLYPGTKIRSNTNQILHPLRLTKFDHETLFINCDPTMTSPMSAKKLSKFCALSPFTPVITHLHQHLQGNKVEYFFRYQSSDQSFRNSLFPLAIHELLIPIPGLESRDLEISHPSHTFQFFLKSFNLLYEVRRQDPYTGVFHLEPDDYILTLFDSGHKKSRSQSDRNQKI